MSPLTPPLVGGVVGWLGSVGSPLGSSDDAVGDVGGLLVTPPPHAATMTIPIKTAAAFLAFLVLTT
jgi:hypothetical protein